MSSLIIAAKGRVTLSKDILSHLGVHAGEKVTVEKLPGGRIELRGERATGKISDVFGFLTRKGGPSLSIDKINKASRKGWTGRK